ncbi:MAG TPA: hypothetical protein VNC16_12555 [Solirubrobacterales bacterium]|jgi:hypothetical protein|nr:hypothetical protein [Solirubrobacterales bacterium]
MQDSKAEVRAREQRWAIPAGIASILAVVLLFAAKPLNVSGDGQAEFLREVDAHGGQVVLSDLMQALAFLLLALPLVYLFRAVAARSDRVRPQLIGLVVAAPLFLAISSGLSIGVTKEGADNFLAGKAEPSLTPSEAREECSEEKEDEGNDFLVDEYDPGKGETPLRACEDRKLEDDEATEAIGESSLVPIATGLGLAGVFGLVVALLYTGLWAMRTGLLSRFWGSLAMVAGIAFLLGPLIFVTMVFFVYLGLLALGFVPGGRPPAWEAGEAIPWPTPGERAAAEMEPQGGWDEADEADEDEERATPPDRR